MADNYDDSMKWLVDEIEKLENGDLECAGIYANKRGYHNKRENLGSDDYSVQLPPDHKGPNDKASAFDMTSKSAQGKNYTIINKYSKRLLAAGQARDPRLAGWREFFGQTDADGTVEGWDFFKHKASTSADKSHNWHVHCSELREYITSRINKEAMLSVWSGETLAAYKKRGGKFVIDPVVSPPKPSVPTTHQTVVVDGDLGPKTIVLWQKIMHTPVDGKIDPKGSDLIEAVQRRLNIALGLRGNLALKVDGQFGPKTIAALQRYLKLPIHDGKIDADNSPTVKALQRRLNTGQF